MPTPGDKFGAGTEQRSAVPQSRQEHRSTQNRDKVRRHAARDRLDNTRLTLPGEPHRRIRVRQRITTPSPATNIVMCLRHSEPSLKV